MVRVVFGRISEKVTILSQSYLRTQDLRWDVSAL